MSQVGLIITYSNCNGEENSATITDLTFQERIADLEETVRSSLNAGHKVTLKAKMRCGESGSSIVIYVSTYIIIYNVLLYIIYTYILFYFILVFRLGHFRHEQYRINFG